MFIRVIRVIRVSICVCLLHNIIIILEAKQLFGYIGGRRLL